LGILEVQTLKFPWSWDDRCIPLHPAHFH
jgi:hypothetical protein